MNYQTDLTALPAELRIYAGRILDIDSHEMLPAQVWVDELGPVWQDFADLWMNNGMDVRNDPNHPNVPGYKNDDMPIQPQTIWLKKGSSAPGGADPRRRLDVMDVMGIKRQLMFPTSGLFANMLTYLDSSYGYGNGLKRGPKEYGRELVQSYNKWGMKVARHSDRVRPVLPVAGDTVEALLATARELIDNGVQAFWLPSAVLPGGRSPAHTDLDPFWSLVSDRNVAICLHVGHHSKIYGTDEWSNAPAFADFRALGEIKTDAWSLANLHIPSQNFVATMVLGGVFERHPMLRFGIVELGAGWIGPLCDLLDMWYESDPGGVKAQQAAKGEGFRLARKPSQYLKRNVRAHGFYFEPYDKYITQYGLDDVVCFATDYPHVEGGKNPMGHTYDRIRPLGEQIVEKFYVTNAKWLLPD